MGSPPPPPPPPPPHALILPCPAQGHVIPLLELSHCLVDRGFEITFVNTVYNHHRLVDNDQCAGIHMVSIPDGLGPGDDRNDFEKLIHGTLNVMPGCLEELIRKINNDESANKITCMIADQTMAWALQVAKKTNLRSAAFYPASAALLATKFSIPKLIQDGTIDSDGVVKKHEMIQLSPGMPLINTADFMWNCMGDPQTGRMMFNYLLVNNRATEIAEHIICNSFYHIEAPVFAHAPNIIPVGPLIAGLRGFGKPIGDFWHKDTACTAWLDEQPANSVVYVAFGSSTVFNKRQFQELALGLELTGRRFLWVVRADLTDEKNDAYPDGFRQRVAGRGRMVGWSPQQQVLAHPSVACFVSHCGWNSTMEGVRNGVPFLCWPYFADQFLNQSYICDVWRTGLRMTPDESTGIISKEQIVSKVDELLGDEEMKARALALKEMAIASVKVGGSSFNNFNSFVEAMK